MRPNVFRRPAFTLFGLLVILAILGLLFALLLPALARVREAANRMKCANNLKQIAIAAHNYHNDYLRLPAGYLGPWPTTARLDDNHQNVGCLAIALPYMEQDALRKQIQIEWGLLKTGPAWYADAQSGAKNRLLSATRIKLFRCPSDTQEANLSAGVVVAFHNVGLTMESKVLSQPDANLPAWTNYTGVAGCLGRTPHTKKDIGPLAMFEGVMSNRSDMPLGQLAVQDGTSNTLIYGEGLGGVTMGQRDRAWSWMGVGAMVTYYGLSPNPPATDPPTAHYRFGSRHPKGVQFCFGDGSTRTIRWGKTAEVPAVADFANINFAAQATDWILLQQLAGRKDGYNHDVSAILE